MTTITIEKGIKLTNTKFSTIDDFLRKLLQIQKTSVEEEKFSHKEKFILENRSNEIIKLENKIVDLLK